MTAVEEIPTYVRPISEFDPDGEDSLRGGVGDALLSHAFIPYLAKRGLTGEIIKPTTEQDCQEATDRILNTFRDGKLIHDVILQAKNKNESETKLIWLEPRRGGFHAGWLFKKHPTRPHWLLDKKRRPDGTEFFFGATFDMLQRKLKQVWGDDILDDILNYEKRYAGRTTTFKNDCIMSLFTGERLMYLRPTKAYGQYSDDALIPLLLTDFEPHEAFTIEIPKA